MYVENNKTYRNSMCIRKGFCILGKEDHVFQLNTVTEHDVRKIIELIEATRYGSVMVIVQDGKIVQIEKNEKIRLR